MQVWLIVPSQAVTPALYSAIRKNTKQVQIVSWYPDGTVTQLTYKADADSYPVVDNVQDLPGDTVYNTVEFYTSFTAEEYTEAKP